MGLFAEYRPRKGKDQRDPVGQNLIVRAALDQDVPAMARLSQARNGGEVAKYEAGATRVLANRDRGQGVAAIAEYGGQFAGFGQGAWWEPPLGQGPSAPHGWYLTGVVVAEAFRRRGIGEELTRFRLDALLQQTSEVRFVASAENRPSIDLHEGLGFELELKGVVIPGLSFTGGVGLLFRYSASTDHA